MIHPHFVSGHLLNVLAVGSNFWYDDFVTLTVNVDDFDRRIGTQVLTQFGDVNVHASCIEVVVVYPDGL